MPDSLQRLRGILGHKLPQDFAPDNWGAWYEVVRSAANEYPPSPGVANVMELFKNACSRYAAVVEEAVYKWDTRRIEDFLERVRLYSRARQFIEGNLDEILADIDWTRVPRADNPKWDLLGDQSALTIDEAGKCLTGLEAPEIIHIDQLLDSSDH